MLLDGGCIHLFKRKALGCAKFNLLTPILSVFVVLYIWLQNYSPNTSTTSQNLSNHLTDLLPLSEHSPQSHRPQADLWQNWSCPWLVFWRFGGIHLKRWKNVSQPIWTKLIAPHKQLEFIIVLYEYSLLFNHILIWTE